MGIRLRNTKLYLFLAYTFQVSSSKRTVTLQITVCKDIFKATHATVNVKIMFMFHLTATTPFLTLFRGHDIALHQTNPFTLQTMRVGNFTIKRQIAEQIFSLGRLTTNF